MGKAARRLSSLRRFAAGVGYAARRAQKELAVCDDVDGVLHQLFQASDQLLALLGAASLHLGVLQLLPHAAVRGLRWELQPSCFAQLPHTTI